MNLLWTAHAWEDYETWQALDRSVVEKINVLIRESRRSPFKGLGKPEPLKGDLSGFWSRRIQLDHRFVYRVAGSGASQRLEILQCRFHYEK